MAATMQVGRGLNCSFRSFLVRQDCVGGEKDNDLRLALRGIWGRRERPLHR